MAEIVDKALDAVGKNTNNIVSPDSNYWLDLSKKGIITNYWVDPTTLKADQPKTTLTDAVFAGDNSLASLSLKADIDTKFLQNFSINYKENFGKYSDVLNSKFNELTKVIQSAISLVFKKKFEITADSLRGKLMEAEILLNYFNVVHTDDDESMHFGKSTENNNDLYTKLEKIVNAYNKISIYRIPSRKNMPGISLGNNDLKLTFNFAFGKCNLFNAREEVWKPMNRLYRLLISMGLQKAGDIPGLYRIVGSSIPYDVYGTVEMIKAMKDLTTGDWKGEDKIESPGQLNSYVTTLTNAKSALSAGNGGDKDKLESYLDEQYRKIDSQYENDNFKKDSNIEVQINADTIKNYFHGVDKNSFPEKKLFRGKEWYENITNFAGGKKAINNWLDENPGISLKDGRSGYSIEDYEINAPNPKDNEEKINNVSAVLRSIAQLNLNAVGLGLSNAYTKIPKFYLYTGFIPMFAHTLDKDSHDSHDPNNPPKTDGLGLKQLAMKYPPFIKYGPFAPEEVGIKFDMQNLDREGYPMSGSITLKAWNLLSAGFGVVFNDNGLKVDEMPEKGSSSENSTSN